MESLQVGAGAEKCPFSFSPGMVMAFLGVLELLSPRSHEKPPSLQSRWAERGIHAGSFKVMESGREEKLFLFSIQKNLMRMKSLNQRWTKRLEVTAAGFGEEMQPAAGSA